MNESGPVFRLKFDPTNGQNVLRLMPVSVYAHYDSAGTCLYVGHTSDLVNRRYHHRSKSPWFDDGVEVRELGLYLKRGDALIAEARAIRELNPSFNVIHNRRDAA